MILKFCVKLQYSCSSKGGRKSDSTKKEKKNNCVGDLESIIYRETKEVRLIS